MVEYLVIILLFLLFYTWLGYPLLLFLLNKCVQSKCGDQREEVPIGTVSVLIAAHNEETVIRARLENILCDAAPNAVVIQVFVGSDGSTDGTAGVVKDVADRHKNIHFFEYREQRGKIAVLKDLVKEIDRQTPSAGNIFVFTDANTEFRERALEKLLRHFSDSSVGGVCGKLVFRGKDLPLTMNTDEKGSNRSSPQSGEGAYWNAENWMKEKESRLDSCLGANGAIYGIRAECFWQNVPENTIVDDFVIGMKVREKGKRMVYEPDAVAIEDFPEAEHEWGRRVRIGAGDFQALVLCRKCLSPKYGMFAWSFFSHKVLRWMTPHLGILLGLACLTLICLEIGSSQNTYSSGLMRVLIHLTLTAAALMLLFAGIGRFLHKRKVKYLRFMRLCDYYLSMQLALFVGFLKYCRGDLSGSWERTPRG